MMRLYHTSRQEIRKPDIYYGRRNADFGQGFYLTPDIAFTQRWAAKGMIINEYEFDLSDLQIYRFTRTEAWFQYIFSNRRAANDTLEADVVIGPIANDTIYDTMGIITSGLLKPNVALRLLLIGPEYTQVALKTEKAAQQLKWISAMKVSQTAVSMAALQAEREEYLRQFAREMERIDEENHQDR